MKRFIILLLFLPLVFACSDDSADDDGLLMDKIRGKYFHYNYTIGNGNADFVIRYTWDGVNSFERWKFENDENISTNTDCYFYHSNFDENYALLSSSEQLISIQTTGGLQNEVQYITNFVLVDNNPLTVEMQEHNGHDYTMVQISVGELNQFKEGKEECN